MERGSIVLICVVSHARPSSKDSLSLTLYFVFQICSCGGRKPQVTLHLQLSHADRLQLVPSVLTSTMTMTMTMGMAMTNLDFITSYDYCNNPRNYLSDDENHDAAAPITADASTVQQTCLTAPLSPDNNHGEKKEGIEVVMPASPTSTMTMDVFLLLIDNEEIQHIKQDRNEEEGGISNLYLSDDEDEEDVEHQDGMLEDDFFLTIRRRRPRRPRSLILPPSQCSLRRRSLSANTNTANDRTVAECEAISLTYSHDEDEEDDGIQEYKGEDDDNDGLLGLGCLPDSFMGLACWDACYDMAGCGDNGWSGRTTATSKTKVAIAVVEDQTSKSVS